MTDPAEARPASADQPSAAATAAAGAAATATTAATASTAATTGAPAPGRPAPEQRRVLTVLVLAQVLSGAGLAAGITVGALLAEDMLGTTSLAGLPSVLFTIGSAGAAVVVGRVSQRFGRRPGLVLGYAAGGVGALGVLVAAVMTSVPLLFGALLVYGAGTATSLQARYAGADLATPNRKARAVSTVLVATTLGAVAGPNLVTVTGTLAEQWGIPRLAGPFGLAAVAYGAAALVLFVLLRPDPLLLSRAAEPVADGGAAPVALPARLPSGVRLGAAVMVVTQVVMVAVMTMTPVHLQHLGHGTAAIGVVIAVHVAAMFLPSPLSGWLVDRFGARLVAGLAAATLLSAGLVSGLAPGGAVWALAVGLGLLGFGWSLGLVSGTTLLSRDLPAHGRARVQGNVDVLVALAGAGGAGLSGVVVAGASYTALALGGGILAVGLLPFVLRHKDR
ncbi:MFS transporter [Antribacter gilvus]|uniref:MFS transporter n=1 Tax=Antribacter gilvus TaxID=2304675 RepID=UPI001980EF41|nr:MFS transporter [Antribacter gilvus]